MNFIAGMLYFAYNDEATAFSALSGIIKRHNLEGLYKSDVPLLRAYCYKMNRLLAIFLPKFHYHICKEGINSSYLCSSWFLTIFTQTIQDRNFSPVLLESIFEKFITVINY